MSASAFSRKRAPARAHRAWLGNDSRLPLFVAGLIAVSLLAGLILIDRLEDKRFLATERREVIHRLSGIRSAVEGAINANQQLVRGLAAQVAINPDISSSEFNRLAREILRENVHVRNIGLAPNNVITDLYPRAGNEAAIGLNFLENEAQRDAVRWAIETRHTTMAGPVALVQGGYGVISRAPVWTATSADEAGGSRYWGIVSLVMNPDSLYEAAGLSRPDLDLRIAIRGTNGLGADGEVFYGDAALFDEDPVLLDVSLGEGSWQMAATPPEGWGVASPYRRPLRIAGLVLISAIGALLLLTLRGQQRMLDQERRFRRLFMSHGAVMYLIDPEDLAIVDANPAAERYYGYSRSAMQRKRLSDLSTLPAAELVAKLSKAVGGDSAEVYLGQRLADGTTRDAEVQVSAILTATGKRLWFAILNDVTDRLRAEGSLRHAMKEAQQADRAKGEFLANMSHEIRTPMNAIIGMTHLLAQTELRGAQRAYLASLHSASRRLLGLIDDILDFSRIEVGRLQLDSIPFRLADVFADLANLVGVEAAAKGIALRFSRAAAIPEWLAGDPLRLGQILTNLAGNAVKFSQGGDEVEVAAEVGEELPDGIRLRFRIRDTGPGISTEDQVKLFKLFSQIDASTTRRHGGSGLGLAISRRLVEMMGGKIWVESEQGKGSTFHFTADLGFSEAHHDLPEPPRVESVAGLRGARVLLAEDEETNRLVVRSQLEPFGVILSVAEDGRAALRALAERTFDAVLMDVQMPELDGYGAAAEIRRDPRLARLPILALTAHAMPGDRERCLAAGMDDYLVKPIDPKQLIRTLAKWIATKSMGGEDPIPEAVPIETAPVSLPAAIPGVDIENGLLSVGGNSDLYRRVLATFRVQHRDTARALREAFDSGDNSEAARIAHKLAGGSGTLGINGVYLAARELERAMYADDRASGDELLRGLDASLGEVLESLAVLEQHPREEPVRAESRK